MSEVVYRWIEHTSEVELEIVAETEQDVLREALAAFAELVGDGGRDDLEDREVELRASDRAGLLADWLGELSFLSETQGFVPERAIRLELDGTALRATLVGRTGEPRPLVKAVTLHRLAFAPEGDAWHARVVLDV